MKNDLNMTVEELKTQVRAFIAERGWEKYHNPKDVAESICIEAAELLEIFQWRGVDEIKKLMERREFTERIGEELADIIIYSLSMANIIGIDLSKTVIDKLKKDAEKYPAEKYYGRAHIEE